MSCDEDKKKELTKLLEEIYTDNYSKLYSCAYRMVGNPQDTEDVLQNSFIKAYQNIDKFKSGAKLSTWVYRIVVNECYRFFEYMKKLPLVRITESQGISEKEFFDNIEYTPSMEDNLIIEELREKCLQGFLKCLPKNQRVCFLLQTCLNLKLRDIADILEVTEANVKVILHRGRKRLQEMYDMRCSLIDPEKPCKCYLWVKYMRDNNLPVPEVHWQKKSEALKQEYFQNLSRIQKINYLYAVEARMTKNQFINNLKKVVEIM